MACCVPETTVRLYDRVTGLEMQDIASVQAMRASQHVEGGARVARLELCDYAGDLEPLLLAGVEIVDETGSRCWCGYVAAVWRCCGDIAWGASIDEVFNRVAIRYTVGDEDRQTAWAVDVGSVATWGVRELLIELPADSLLTPEQFRDRILAEASQPQPLLVSRLTEKCECNITYVVARGWWDTLNWTYDNQPCGYANSGYTGTGGAVPLGVGLTSDQIGFGGGDVRSVGTLGLEMVAFPVGEELVISGAADPDNNVITTVQRRLSSTIRILTGTTIDFDPADDIRDTGLGLSRFVVNEMIGVSGSALNDGTYWVKRVISDGSRLEVTPGTILLEGVGPLITLAAGASVGVETDLNAEIPGAMVTILARTQWICQGIYHDGSECNQPWLVNHIRLALRKVGNPLDSVEISIGPDCVMVVATQLVAGADLSMGFATIDVVFPVGVVLNPGGFMTVKLRRTGAPSTSDYYDVASVVDVNLPTAAISTDGINWLLPRQPYTLSVEAFEDEGITDQAERIALAWPYVNTVQVLSAVSYAVPAYRDGSRTLRGELERLIDAGSPTGQRLQITVDCDRNVIIDTEVAPADAVASGVVLDCDGCPVDGDLCTLPAGAWVLPDGVVAPGDLPQAVFLEWYETIYSKCDQRFAGRSLDLARLGVRFEVGGR